MKYSAVVVAFALTGALASPAHHHKRAYVTDLTVVTETIYVTLGQHVPTPAPSPEPTPSPQPQPPQPPVAGPGPGPGPEEPEEPEEPEVEKPVTSSTAPKPSTTAPAPEPSSTLEPEPSSEPEPEPSPSPEPTPPKPEPPADDFKSLALHHHNIHRSNHSATDVVWDNELADAARELAQSCYYEHNTDYGVGGYGQNMGYGYSNIGKLLTNGMYNSEMMYYEGMYGQDQPSNSNFGMWGHFTQIVWKKTERVGCYTHTCASLTDPNHGSAIPDAPFTVCNYGPPGNWAGEYGDNVGKPLGNEMVVV